MQKDDLITLRGYPNLPETKCKIIEYELGGRFFWGAECLATKMLLPITSPEGEPWTILLEEARPDGKNSFSATWERKTFKSGYEP